MSGHAHQNPHRRASKQEAQAQTWTVTYDANSGSGAPVDSSSPYTDGDTVTVLPGDSMTPPSGKIFSEWNTAFDGTGTPYNPGDFFTIVADTTLYAQWIDAGPSSSYTVTYDANGGSGSVPTDASSPYPAGNPVTVLDNTGPLTKSGYAFVGWNTAADDSGTNYAPTDTFTINADTTLYARWKVAFDFDNPAASGSGSATVTQTASGVTMTVTIDNGAKMAVSDLSGASGTSRNVLVDDPPGTSFNTVTFSFDVPVDLSSLQLADTGTGNPANLVFTRSGGSGTSPVSGQTFGDTTGSTVTLGWTAVNSFTVTKSGGGTWTDFVIDNIEFAPTTPASPTITSATYDAATGALVVTGTDIQLNGGGMDIDASMFTFTGEGGGAYTLTDTADVERDSITQFTLTLSATDKATVTQILNKNGTTSTGGTTYNLAAADDWDTAVTSGDTSDATGNGVTVSNVAAPTVTSATYDASTGSLAVTGTGLLKLDGATNDIVANKFTFTGQGGGTYSLTDTANVEITSGTAFTLTLSATDKAGANAILNKNGTSSVDATTYNLAAAEDWAAGADAAVNVADATGNGVTVSNTSAPGAPTIGTATAGDGQATVAFTPGASGSSATTGYTATSSPGGINSSGCTSSLCTVTGLTNGTSYTFTVTATNSVGTGSASSASNSVIPKASQTITFADPGDQTFGTSPTLSATATSGLTVSFTSATTGVCTVSGTTLTFATAGTCTINADQAGSAAYLAAPQVQRSFTVNAVAPGAPTIGTATAGDGQATVGFTAPGSNGGAAITTYTATSSPSGITGSCASSPCMVTGLTNGTAYTFTVTATNSAGTGSASIASNSVTPKANQTITFANPGAQNFGTSPVLSATASSSLTVSFTSATTGVCAITTGGALTFAAAGTCTIDADQPGDGTYSAAPQVSRSFSVNAVAPGAPTIGAVTPGGASATVNFTAPSSNGGAAITSYTATCSSSDGGATGTGTGLSSPLAVGGLTNGRIYTCSVTAANSAGTSSASAASNSITPQATATVPSAPTITGITPGVGKLTVAFTLGSDGGSAITAIKYSIDDGAYVTASETSSPINITGLKNGTSYQVKLLAVNSIGDGEPSRAGSATTQSPTTESGITAPGNLRFDFFSGRSIGLRWDASTIVTGEALVYLLQERHAGATDWTDVGVTSNTFATVTGLESLTSYEFQVIAIDTSGVQGPASNVVLGKTTASVPGPASNVSCTQTGTAKGGDRFIWQATWTIGDDGGDAITTQLVRWICQPTKVAEKYFRPADTTTDEFTGQACTDMNVRIRALNSLGRGAPAWAKCVNDGGGGTGSTALKPAAGSTVTITSTSTDTIDLPASGSINVMLPNGQTLTVTGSEGASLVVKHTTINGQQVTTVEVVGGSATFAPQGSGGSIVTQGNTVISTNTTGTSFQVNDDDDTTSIKVTKGSVTLGSSGSSGNGRLFRLTQASGTFAAANDNVLYAGETAELDDNGNVTATYLGTRQGDSTTLAGDNILTAVNAQSSVRIPRLNANVERLNGAKLDDAIFQTLSTTAGATIATPKQSADGVVIFKLGEQTISAIPIGQVTIDTSRPDGITVTPTGILEVATGGVIARFAPSVASPNGFAGRLLQEAPGSTTALLSGGGYRASINGGATIVGRPVWTLQPSALGQTAFGDAGNGNILYSDNTYSQVLVPDFGDYATLVDTFRSEFNDPALTVVPNLDGTATATVNGRTYTLVPDWTLTTPADWATRPAWWQDQGTIYIKYPDGTAQGFRIR